MAYINASILSTDVVCLIIELTTDLHTLDAWCNATSHNSTLHKVALSTRCFNVEITGEDVISSSGSNGTQSSIPKLIRPFEANVRCKSAIPACHIKELYLNFRFDALKHEFWEKLLTDEDLQHSISSLLSDSDSVREIHHEGILHQENLDTITNQPSLEALRLRTKEPRFPCRWKTPPPEAGDEILRNGRSVNGNTSFQLNYDFCSLKWYCLSRLKHLRRIEICCLCKGEGQSLAQAVVGLDKLEILLLMGHEGHMLGLPWIEPRSHLEEFIDHIF